jgi:acyl-coenzyme A thioesterase PaaI-like protein
MPRGAAVPAVELKIDFVAPAKGESFVVRGRVLKSGRSLSVCNGEVLARGLLPPKLHSLQPFEIFAHVSRSVTARLNTSPCGLPVSLQKYPSLSN